MVFVMAVWLWLAALLGAMGWVGWSCFYRGRALMPVLSGRARFRRRFGFRRGGILVQVWVRRWRRRRVDTCGGMPHLTTRTSVVTGTVLVSGGVAVGLLAGSVAVTFLLANRNPQARPPRQSYLQLDHIRLALTPEKLVPPPPLPPSAFISESTPGLDSADRDWAKLDPVFTQQVLQLCARMQARGYPMALVEGYRSPDRQNKLAGMDRVVTHAKAFQSKHQYGFAADLAPVRDGRVVISEKDPWAMQAYRRLGEEANAIGLGWGGHFSFQDYGHVELRGSIASLLKPQPTLAARQAN